MSAVELAPPAAADGTEEEITVSAVSPVAAGDYHVEEEPAVVGPASASISFPVLVLPNPNPTASSLPKVMQVLLVQHQSGTTAAWPSDLQLQALLVPSPATGNVQDKPRQHHVDNARKAARELRGWLMVLATVIASITYASGLSPPGGFQNGESFYSPMRPVLQTSSPMRYAAFYYCNTGAFALSLSIVLLLASQDLRRLAKIKALEILVALDVLALLVAYIVGSTFGLKELGVCVGLVLIVPVALVVMSSRACGNYFWDEL